MKYLPFILVVLSIVSVIAIRQYQTYNDGYEDGKNHERAIWRERIIAAGYGEYIDIDGFTVFQFKDYCDE